MTDATWPPVVLIDGTGKRWVPESEVNQRDRELAALKETHAALIVKVRHFIAVAHNAFPRLLDAVDERDRLSGLAANLWVEVEQLRERVYVLERKLHAAELRLEMREDVKKLHDIFAGHDCAS